MLFVGSYVDSFQSHIRHLTSHLKRNRCPIRTIIFKLVYCFWHALLEFSDEFRVVNGAADDDDDDVADVLC